MTMEQQLNKILVEILEVNESEITDDMSTDTVDSWDSLNHLKLITAIESSFGIKLGMSDIENMLDVKSIKEKLNEQL